MFEKASGISNTSYDIKLWINRNGKNEWIKKGSQFGNSWTRFSLRKKKPFTILHYMVDDCKRILQHSKAYITKQSFYVTFNTIVTVYGVKWSEKAKWTNDRERMRMKRAELTRKRDGERERERKRTIMVELLKHVSLNFWLFSSSSLDTYFCCALYDVFVTVTWSSSSCYCFCSFCCCALNINHFISLLLSITLMQ